MRTDLFVDETKAKGYLVVAAASGATDLKILRKELRRLVLPGQRALHMKSESDSRRRAIADLIAEMAARGVSATVYDSGRRHQTDLVRRARCIDALVGDVRRAHALAHITFDLDQTLRTFDRQRMIELIRTAKIGNQLTYGHATRSEELLLAIPDAIAWCWARGGDWRRRVEPVVTAVRQV